MDITATRVFRENRSEVVLAAFLSAAAAAVLALAAPPSGDAPAHLYRTLLVQEGVHVWDNLWYAGQYPLVSYSLLYYFPAAVIGNEPLVFASVVLSAVLFAMLVMDEWGEAGRWPARVFGLLAIGPLFTGTYVYALGLTALLATLVAAQRGRTWLAVLLGAVTLGISPLAFVFLCMVLLAEALGNRRVSRRGAALGVGLVLAAAVQIAALTVFPSASRYPFRSFELALVLTTCALGVALAWRAPRGQTLAAFFALWGLASLAAFLVPSPFGENMTRLRLLVFPLMLLAAAVARFRPLPLALLAVAFAISYNALPYAGYLSRVDAQTPKRTYWAPALAFLREQGDPEHRVEVVPTAAHWEAYWVPRAGFALARGWYRQLDIPENELLYEKTLLPAAYQKWLRRMGVRFVLLPEATLDTQGAEREAALLRSGRSGLIPIYATRHWTIFELPNAVPILTGASPSKITTFDHERIEGWTGARGTYRLRVNYTRYWKVVRGRVCVRRAPDGMTLLRSARKGPFTLVIRERPVPLVRRALSGAGC